TALGLTAETQSGARRWTYLVAAGLLGGIALTIRPLTALAIGVSVWIWLGVRAHSAGKSWLAMTGGLAAGAIVPILALLWFNAATNGSPLTLGYTAAHAGGHGLGMSSGRLVYDQFGEPVVTTRSTTPWHAVQRNAFWIAGYLRSILPFATAAPLAWMAWRAGLMIRPVALAFLALPIAYLFWLSVTGRLFSELLVFVALGLALLLAKLLEQRPTWARWTVAVLVIAGLVDTSVHIAGAGKLPGRWSPYMARVNAAAAAGPTLIFVGGNQLLYEKMWWFNARDWMGKVVVARDLGARNRELIARFPHHAAYRVSWRAGITKAADVPIAAICGPRAQPAAAARCY
ncbi:MAG: hypothetical protein ACREOG_17350, partial [Gemmatimonadaceae bacterium]